SGSGWTRRIFPDRARPAAAERGSPLTPTLSPQARRKRGEGWAASDGFGPAVSGFVEDERPQLDALARQDIGRSGRVLKGGMGGKSCRAILRRVVALDQGRL